MLASSVLAVSQKFQFSLLWKHSWPTIVLVWLVSSNIRLERHAVLSLRESIFGSEPVPWSETKLKDSSDPNNFAFAVDVVVFTVCLVATMVAAATILMVKV